VTTTTGAATGTTRLRACEEVLFGPWHYLSGQIWMVRAAIRAARGDETRAAADVELALACARKISQPQVRYYLIPFAAYVLARAGAPEQAEPLAAEFLDFLARGPKFGFEIIALASFAEAARSLNLDRELATALADVRPSPWVDAARAYALATIRPRRDSLTNRFAPGRRRGVDARGGIAHRGRTEGLWAPGEYWPICAGRKVTQVARGWERPAGS